MPHAPLVLADLPLAVVHELEQLADEASAKGKSTGSIARHLRHKSETTTKRYVRPQTVFRDNASSGV